MAAACSLNVIPRLFSGTKCAFGCYKSTVRPSMHRKVIYNHLPQIRRYSMLKDDSSADEDKCSVFEKMVRDRRRQIEKSVLVHVNSKYCITSLYELCSKYGDIARTFQYKLENKRMFVLVEFKSVEGAQKLLTNVRHAIRQKVIPVHSHYLWYGKTEQVKEDFCSSSWEFTTLEPPTDEDIINTLHNARTISDQMTSLHELLRLPELGQLLRFLVCHQMESAFSGLFTNCTVLPFGSSVNGFGKFNCDLDMVMSLGEASLLANESPKLYFQAKCSLSNSRSQVQRYLENLSDTISNYLPGCINVQKILQARVPIVKFRHELVNTECDLTMNNLSGVYMSELLYLYGEFDDRVRPLVFTVLKWARHNGITQEVPGHWITNFSLIMMVIVFLQSRPNPILPSLEALRKLSSKEDHRSSEGGVDCSFVRDVSKFPKKDNADKLGDLLQQFFHYYATFDFKNRGLSLNAGFDVIKPEYCPLYIQNPFETQLNVCKNVSADELERIHGRIETALWKLETCSQRNSGNSWGLLELFDVRQHIDAGKFRRFPVSNLFDKAISNYANPEKVANSRNGAMAVDAESANSDSGIVPSRNRKKRNSNKTDLVNQLKLERFLQGAFSAAKSTRAVSVNVPKKNKKKKSSNRNSQAKPWTF